MRAQGPDQGTKLAGWGASFAATSWQSHLLRVEAGQVRPFEQLGMAYAEPTFVPRPQGESPSDGVILSVGCHQSEPPSALVSLGAEQVRPIAHGEVDLSRPLGFPGNFQVRWGAGRGSPLGGQGR